MNVPVPVAARTHRSGIWWAKYDILVSYIENSSNLVNILKQRTLSSNEIAEIAKSVIQLAANGVYHSDLNIHNLLIDDQGRIWIIDFDKSKLIPNGCVERMLERLQRSFAKERRLALEAKESFFFTDDVFDSIKTQVMQGLSASKR
jgi:RIO-like serine/threonine protein kinase